MIKYSDKIENRFRIDVKKLKSKRSILTNVHFTNDGHIEMTNGIIAIRLFNVHDQDEQLKYGENSDEQYPNLDQIFNKTYGVRDHIGTLKTKKLEDFVESFKSIKPDKIKVDFFENEVILSLIQPEEIYDGTIGKIKHNGQINNNTTIYFTYSYLLLVLKFMRMIGADEIEINQSGTITNPVSFSYHNLQVILMPVRIKGV